MLAIVVGENADRADDSYEGTEKSNNFLLVSPEKNPPKWRWEGRAFHDSRSQRTRAVLEKKELKVGRFRLRVAYGSTLLLVRAGRFFTAHFVHCVNTKSIAERPKN